MKQKFSLLCLDTNLTSQAKGWVSWLQRFVILLPIDTKKPLHLLELVAQWLVSAV